MKTILTFSSLLLIFTFRNNRHKDAQFAADWQTALDLAADALESDIRKRALAGSDLLEVFLMKGLRPEKFTERAYIPAAELDKLIECELATLKGEEETEADSRRSIKGRNQERVRH